MHSKLLYFHKLAVQPEKGLLQDPASEQKTKLLKAPESMSCKNSSDYCSFIITTYKDVIKSASPIINHANRFSYDSTGAFEHLPFGKELLVHRASSLREEPAFQNSMSSDCSIRFQLIVTVRGFQGKH